MASGDVSSVFSGVSGVNLLILGLSQEIFVSLVIQCLRHMAHHLPGMAEELDRVFKLLSYNIYSYSKAIDFELCIMLNFLAKN